MRDPIPENLNKCKGCKETIIFPSPYNGNYCDACHDKLLGGNK